MKIFDTTIRDGSYAVDFKFTCDDVRKVIKKSEKLGIEYIEIGHGQGLNASSVEHGLSMHTDVEYMDAARQVAKNSKYGFFCIPGIARIEDLNVAKKHGVSFIRIGINPRCLDKAEKYISVAKEHGLIVMVNFMKSYTVSPDVFATEAKKAEILGADYVYLVDSAGCMLPEQIGVYYDETRKISDIKLGFHGHNNLGMAVSNSLYCVNKGFDMIDTSFQGLGRSLGNTPTEMFVMAMEKYGLKTNIDIPCLLEYGYELLRDIVDRKKLAHPLDLACGYAGFHSSYLKDIYRCCESCEVDPLRLILAYSELDKINLDYEKLCQVARELPRDEDLHPYSFREFFSEAYND